MKPGCQANEGTRDLAEVHDLQTDEGVGVQSPCPDCTLDGAMLTCVSSRLQTCHAIKHVVGANVAGEGLDGVLPKACGPPKIDQDQVEAHSDQEGIASEEGGRVAGVGAPMGKQNGGSGLLCVLVTDQDCLNRQIRFIAGRHLR